MRRAATLQPRHFLLNPKDALEAFINGERTAKFRFIMPLQVLPAAFSDVLFSKLRGTRK
jgi:hypothetical protein